MKRVSSGIEQAQAGTGADHVIAVTGLAFEAKIAAGRGVLALVGGGNAAALEIALSTHLSARARGIVSFGICGGLKRGLTPGTCIIGRAVIAATSRWSTDDAWSEAIAACLPHAVRGDIAAVDAPISSPEEKARLHMTTRAIAVDTESHVAARLALRHQLPFVAFRVIADPANRALPPAAQIALQRNGRVNVLAVLRSMIEAPGQIPSLFRLGLDAGAGLRALALGRRRLGSAMSYPNFRELLFDVP